ncbi:hypothetical protein AB990_17280 [Alkalihalobacillus pseudalcaliphilus]|nr:hypothetical protein AB990_17280 [Alkalihalobacillus pseudalcaliphilus]
MKTTIQAWGNASVIRIPPVYKRMLQVNNGDEVEIRIENHALIIEKSNLKEWALRELMEKYDVSTEHEEIELGAEGEEWL